MNLAGRLVLTILGVAAMVIIVLASIGIYLGLVSRDELAFEAGDKHLKFLLWVDHDVFQEGDPSLLLEVVGGDGEVIQGKHTLGTAFGWYESKNLDLHVLQNGGLAAIVHGDSRLRPLVIWDERTYQFAPRDTISPSQDKWLASALARFNNMGSGEVCLGYLAHGEVQCH